MSMEPIDNQKYIARLLDRFLQGDSTLEEEQILADYFRSAADLPTEWEDFRTMFRYFDQGMEHIDYAQQEEAASGLLSALPITAHRPFRWWLTAAFGIALCGSSLVAVVVNGCCLPVDTGRNGSFLPSLPTRETCSSCHDSRSPATHCKEGEYAIRSHCYSRRIAKQKSCGCCVSQ